MSDLARPTSKRISRPNGRKAIRRVFADLDALIERAPLAPCGCSHWRMDAEAACDTLLALLQRMYAK